MCIRDRPSISAYTKIITSFLSKKFYPQTPGLPVFWATQPNKTGYGKPVGQTFTGGRQHIHLWETDFTDSNGNLIWVGTAHFDEEIQKKFGIVMPFHSTELKVDTERERIKSELDTKGFIQKSEKIDLTGLMYGSKKGSGNSFLTDGQAYILYIK
ncbi:MAG: LssY C-terminal domain-containing protein, partial [Candidatus Shapirobacteria bacterium]|nr:LssY C-terminal domain-containing protein [Candidatus Shapirobacteria bacterium]